MDSTLVAVEHDFDAATLSEFAELRSTRLSLAVQQFFKAEDTVSELIRRGLLPEGDRLEYVTELRSTLVEKINDLKKRETQSHLIHYDEIELYLDAMKNVPNC